MTSGTEPVDTDRVLRVLLVDDHALLRDGLREIVELEDDIVVAGEAGSGAEALRILDDVQPDVIVLDVEIPGENVAVTVRTLRSAAPEASIIILSMHDAPSTVQRLLGLGVSAYLLKSIKRNTFVAAIRSVHQDPQRVVLSVSRESLTQIQQPEASPLSSREREIMALVARAMSNAQIAGELYITEGTVKRHLRNIFTKLGAYSRIDALNKAGIPQQRPY